MVLLTYLDSVHTRHSQTLYGHTGTVTGIFVYGRHILSCSTDRTIRVWAEVEGRKNLAYPWYEQVRVCEVWCSLSSSFWILHLSVHTHIRPHPHTSTPMFIFQQAVVATLDGWVRSMSFGRTDSPGDNGVFYAVRGRGRRRRDERKAFAIRAILLGEVPCEPFPLHHNQVSDVGSVVRVIPEEIVHDDGNMCVRRGSGGEEGVLLT